MKFKPTSSCRHVVLNIQVVTTNPNISRGMLSAINGRVVSIAIIVDDGEKVAETSFVSDDEGHLLRSFWDNIQPNDVFIGRSDLELDLTFVRQRSLITGMQLFEEFTLRRFYSHEVVDLLRLWSASGSVPPRSMVEPSEMLGLLATANQRMRVQEWWASRELDAIIDFSRTTVRATFEVYLELTHREVPERNHRQTDR